MSHIIRTVEQLMNSPEHRSRLFAVDLMLKNAHVFDPVDLTERLKLASLDAHPEVAKRAKQCMSTLLKQDFREQQRIRALGIDSRLMDVSETDMLMEQDVRQRAHSVLEPVMRKVVELASQSGPMAAEALEVLGRSCDIEYSEVLIGAAAAGDRRGPALEALKGYKITELPSLMENLLDTASGDDDLQRIADVLGDSALEAAVPLLATLLKSPTESVRQRAATALGRISGNASEKALLERLDDPSPAVKAAILASIAKVGRGGSSDKLLAAFPTLQQPELIIPALAALARIKSSRGLPLVIQSLASPVTAVKAAAVEALGKFKLKEDEVKMHLVPLLNDPEVTVRANAIKSLYAHDLQKAASALRTMLGSKRAAERGAAMAIMPDVQDPPSMEEFLVAINTEQDRSVLAGGLDALDKITDPRLAKAVHRLMSHPNPALQMKAVRAYGRIAGTAGIKDLDRLYDETPSQDLKSTILNVLGGMCESGNISFLTKRLKESDERVVANAIEGLDRVGSIENSMLLESFLSHGSPRVRANAVVALFHTGNFKCLSVLTEMLSRPDANAHRSALHAMKQIHASLAWAEVQKRPLLLTPLNERPMNPTTSQSMALPRETERMRPPEEPRPIPRTTKRIAVDRSTAEERALVRAAQAMSDSDMKTAKDLVDRVIAAQPDSELAQFVLQRITAGTPENGPVPAELLEKSTFLPLLGEETRRAKASRSAKMLLESYFRIFERQLDVMRSVIAEGRDYLAKGSEAAAMEVAKFVVSQMQWTVDFDVRLGLVFYDKQDWERAFTHLMRAYIASGGEASLGVHLAAVAMKIRKRELAKALLGPILDSETTDPLIRGRAVQVAQAIAVLDNPDSEGTISS